MKVYVYAHMYMFSTFHNVVMSFGYISYIFIHLTYFFKLSSIVKETTTFEMELRGHKQATAHSHEHNHKFESFKKKISGTTKFEFESAD